MSLFTLDGRLHLAPIPNNVKRVLDIGTGTGIWAIEFGTCFPTFSSDVAHFLLFPQAMHTLTQQ